MDRPGNDNIVIADNGEPSLRGFRCNECGAVSEKATIACRKCHARGVMEEFTASESGRLVTWSIVHRSFPGIPVPFVSAVCEMDDGLTLKGNVVGCEHDELHAGMPVTVRFTDARGAKDKDGNGFVAYEFVAQPAREKELS